MEGTLPPQKVQLDRQARRLVIAWPDGVCVDYPWPLLRAHCPSAGERVDRQTSDPDPLAILGKVPSSELIEVRLVGNYAIGLTWADGHNAGIYTWQLLRELADHDDAHCSAIV